MNKSKIKIKNFGPINSGFSGSDGFLPIDKVMVFIGNQGSGKSSVVKLISTLTWLEKALYKKIIKTEDITKKDSFKEVWCEYQSIQNYFRANTLIDYKGDYLDLIFSNNKVKIKLNEESNYQLPKITYIPAERNFLSVLEELEDIKRLPKSLSWTLDEYIKACKSQSKPIPINISDIKVVYNSDNKTSTITGNGFENLKLSEASSGIQSVVPMVVVLYYLEFFVNSKKLNSIDNASYGERQMLKDLESTILSDETLTDESKKDKIEKLKYRILPNHLFTIIEEIEQNLFPASQKSILFNTLQRVNNKGLNHLILTTHSPYIIAYITLVLKAFKLYDEFKEKFDDDDLLFKKLLKIVPYNCFLNPETTSIYQINDEGEIFSIKSERGLILDNNFLNNSLEETNSLFDELLDIEELCK